MRWIALLGWIALCFAVASISGVWTAKEVAGWYRTLQRPGIAPPDWVFGPVWTMLYLLMAIAAWLISQSPASSERTLAIVFFLIQLTLNFAWSWIFFRSHAIGTALAEIVILWLVILACTVLFSHISTSAAWLMAPYLAWVSFAVLLNAAFWRLNPARA